MVATARKRWQELTRTERRHRVNEILGSLESRQRREPVPMTTGEWWESVGYLQLATLFAYSVLETQGRWKPVIR
jgi:hypothetical protein